MSEELLVHAIHCPSRYGAQCVCPVGTRTTKDRSVTWADLADVVAEACHSGVDGGLTLDARALVTFLREKAEGRR